MNARNAVRPPPSQQSLSQSSRTTHTAQLTRISHPRHTLSTLPSSEANVRAAVSKGYVSGLLTLYQDWHSGDVGHAAIGIRLALLRCLHQVAHSAAGREAVLAHGGIRLLFQTTQVVLFLARMF